MTIMWSVNVIFADSSFAFPFYGPLFKSHKEIVLLISYAEKKLPSYDFEQKRNKTFQNN